VFRAAFKTDFLYLLNKRRPVLQDQSSIFHSCHVTPLQIRIQYSNTPVPTSLLCSVSFRLISVMGFILKAERDGIMGTLPPPPGVNPNFENPESQGYRVVLAIAILFPLATIVLFLRVYTSVVIVRNFGTDDCKLLCCQRY
jgi:hypothetical protein